MATSITCGLYISNKTFNLDSIAEIWITFGRRYWCLLSFEEFNISIQVSRLGLKIKDQPEQMIT